MVGKSIFIFEFVSGGGFNKQDIPISLFCEGFGMLNSLIKDFKSLDFEVYTLLDYRINQLSSLLAVNHIIIKKEGNLLNHFEELVERTDYSFIIAPESQNILLELTKIVQKHQKDLLSTNLEGIVIGTSKMKTYDFFQKNKLLTPKTYLIPLKNKQLNLDFIIRKFNEMNKSIVIKPEDGVGAESIYYFETIEQIKEFFHQENSKIDTNRNYILQEYIEGKDISISLINMPGSRNKKSNKSLLLSINSQFVDIKNYNYESEYFGGYTPIENFQQYSNELMEILKEVDFSSFSGYFGIDLIRSDDSKFYFIEINPRLTTSYIGIRNVIIQNPAKLIMDSRLNLLQSKTVSIPFFSIFTRIELTYTKSRFTNKSKESLINELMRRIPEFVTPPISLDDSNQFTCFIATKTEKLHSSKIRIKEIERILQDLNFSIVKQRLTKLM